MTSIIVPQDEDKKLSESNTSLCNWFLVLDINLLYEILFQSNLNVIENQLLLKTFKNTHLSIYKLFLITLAVDYFKKLSNRNLFILKPNVHINIQ